MSLLEYALLALGGAGPAFAQLVADPNERLYSDLDLWMDRGLTAPLRVVSYYTQGMIGRPDNRFIGVSGGVKLPGAVTADFILNTHLVQRNRHAQLNCTKTMAGI